MSAVAMANAVRTIPALVGLRGQVVVVRWRLERTVVVARVAEGAGGARRVIRPPIRDQVALEFASGAGENESWPRPVDLEAVINTGLNAVGVVEKASRWASYAARVAVVPADRVSDAATLEATLRGVWLVGAGDPPSVVTPGEVGRATGSARGCCTGCWTRWCSLGC